MTNTKPELVNNLQAELIEWQTHKIDEIRKSIPQEDKNYTLLTYKSYCAYSHFIAYARESGWHLPNLLPNILFPKNVSALFG